MSVSPTASLDISPTAAGGAEQAPSQAASEASSLSRSSFDSINSRSNPYNTYNPYTNRGRRPTAEAAVNARAAQLREAQRAHRERKRLYLQDLEQRAKEADSARAQITLLEDQLRAAEQQQQIQRIQLQQLQLEQQQQQLHRRDSHDSSSPSMAGPPLQMTQVQNHSMNWLALPAFAFVPAIFGCPQLEIRTVELMLLAVAPLTASPSIVARFVRLVRAMVSCSDRRELRRLLGATVKTACSILDRCSIVEKTNVIEILALLLKSNSEIYVMAKKFSTYLNNAYAWETTSHISSRPSFQPPEDVLHRRPNVVTEDSESVFLKTLKSIESIGSMENLDDLLNEMGDLFHVSLYTLSLFSFTCVQFKV
ncbi:hypothetical protein HDU83_001142 [Entophlyctis luteolus]|nr:hypothetical protein HDU83_001142 [Entophlyctis luteolus]